MFWKKGPFLKKRIYADAAASTPISKNALLELERLLPLFGNPNSLHREAVAAKNELEDARNTIAYSIGAHADEIVFTSSGTEANNLAINGVFKFGNAVTTTIEHPSVLEPLRMMKSRGLTVTELVVDSEGIVDPKKIQEAITADTTFVSIQLVNSEIGTIEPVREIAKVIRHIKQVSATKLYFHTDASQAPLWLDIKVEKLGVDLMTLDAQKVLGPKGIGCLYVKRGTPLEPLILGGSQERGLRSGTENLPLTGSFAVALKDAQSGVDNRVQKISEVRNYLLSEIQRLIPDVKLNGPQVPSSIQDTKADRRVANNLNISIPRLNAEMAVIAMDAEGVAVSTRSACAVEDDNPSYVIRAILEAEMVDGADYKDISFGAIRISLLPDATKVDAKRIAVTLFEIAKRYRNVL